MINLYTSFYIDKNPDRQKELEDCLMMNIKCEYIDHIYVITDGTVESDLLLDDKVTEYSYKYRPTYNTFFEVIRMTSKPDDWNIIANTDIYFDNTLELLDKYKSGKPICFALCRWEVLKDKIEFLNRPDSQDSWIFKGLPRRIDGNFCLGTCGCDNAIAHRFMMSGYNVINPSRSIKTYHLHLSGVRNYNVNHKVKEPYKIIHPTE